MSHRKTVRRSHERTYEEEPPQQYTWIVYAVGMLLIGGLAGYVLSTATTPRTVVVTAAGVPAAAPATGGSGSMVNETVLQTYRDILARDPRNVQAAVDAGNMLYDAHRYDEAIGFYERALAVNAADVNVSTDLGTALWYSGKADAALAQYETSLRIDPDHAQTLFNIGIVRSDGKRDYAGAVKAWELLLQKNPAYPEAAKVRTMIGEARSKVAGTAN
ncbi:MAG: tetratricopeptide repeat protein [Vicinamibacterales bacterium]